jgi:hypothetical protein
MRLLSGQSQQRLFPDWTMAFIDSRDPQTWPAGYNPFSTNRCAADALLPRKSVRWCCRYARHQAPHRRRPLVGRRPTPIHASARSSAAGRAPAPRRCDASARARQHRHRPRRARRRRSRLLAREFDLKCALRLPDVVLVPTEVCHLDAVELREGARLAVPIRDPQIVTVCAAVSSVTSERPGKPSQERGRPPDQQQIVDGPPSAARRGRCRRRPATGQQVGPTSRNGRPNRRAVVRSLSHSGAVFGLKCAHGRCLRAANRCCATRIPGGHACRQTVAGAGTPLALPPAKHEGPQRAQIDTGKATATRPNGGIAAASRGAARGAVWAPQAAQVTPGRVDYDIVVRQPRYDARETTWPGLPQDASIRAPT